MSKEKKLVPKLRFPEFSGEWENKKLGEIAKFSKGKNISKSDISDEGIECIRYGELYTHYSELIKKIYSKTNLNKKDLVLSKVNDVIIPASGETAIDISTASCIQKSGIALSGDINIIRSKENGIFLSYYFNNKKKIDIARLAQGISVIHLYTSQLFQLNLNLPSLPEQEKIASFLSKVDEKIEKLERKKALWEEYKKGVMQRIFSREIRFKDDEGQEFCEWKEKPLGKIGKTYNGLTGKTKENFGIGKPYIQYKQIFDSSQINENFGFVEVLDNENQNKVKYGDIFFTTSSETPGEVGMSSVLLNEIDETYLNSFCFGYRPNSLKQLYPLFSRYLFRSDIVRKEIVKLAQGSTRYNMSKNEFMKIKIKIPSLPEQEKISNFLSNLDTKIDVLEREIERNKEFKRGLLQGLFV